MKNRVAKVLRLQFHILPYLYCALIGAIFTTTARAQDGSVRPKVTAEAIGHIKVSRRSNIRRKDISGVIIERSDRNPKFVATIGLDKSETVIVPLVVKGSFLVALERDLNREDIQNVIETYDLSVGHVYKNLDTLLVKIPLPELSNVDLLQEEQAQFDIMLKVANRLEEDARIASVAINSVVRTNQVTDNVLKVNEVFPLIVETQDWGIKDIQADVLWADPRAHDGVMIGVLDAGFGRHEDINFKGTFRRKKRDDHGNHVAGIACAKHNSVGTRGVLPTCFVKAETNKFFRFKSKKGQPVDEYLNLFSQILANVDRFLDPSDGISIYNLSLGYGWMNNFGINIDVPSTPEIIRYRNMVQGQASIALRTLEEAEKSDKVIFMSAGNDNINEVQGNPISATYASPFNFAALSPIMAAPKNRGVVVEAHNTKNIRANFSNIGGHISCPGVDILSAVAHDSDDRRSKSSYAEMSGTSMASPYCAAGHLLFKQLRPNYSNTEIIDCLRNSGQDSRNKAPRLKLVRALKYCSARKNVAD